MKKELFEQWLKSKGVSSFGNYVSRLKSIEEVEGDLDAIYDLDKCADLITKYTYSREDKVNRIPPRHNIPIKSLSANKDLYESYFEGTNDFKSRISRYIQFRNSETSEDENLSIVDRIKKTCDKLLADGKLLSLDQLNQGYSIFSDKFSPEKLKTLDGELLLDTMFNIGNHSGLFYWMEFKNDDEFHTYDYGSIAGGSAFKYIMYKRNLDSKWVTGYYKDPIILNTEQAIELGREIRNALVTGANEINSLKNNNDESRYMNLFINLENKILNLKSSRSNMARLGWVHKYYHMIYPSLIDDFHSTKWQRHGLISCGIKPDDDNLYSMSGQYAKLANECKLPINYITSAIYELFGSPVNYFRIDTIGDNKSYWNEMRTGGYASIGWPKIGDLRNYDEQDKSTLKTKLVDRLEKEYPNYPPTISKNANQILSFYTSISQQDIVVAVEGEKVLGVGQVSGEYEYVDGLEFPHTIKTDWIYIAETRLPKPSEGNQTAVYQYREMDNILAIEKLANTPFIEDDGIIDGGGDPPPLPPLSGMNLQIDNILARKKQIILYGPPGTGKTYHAEKACFELAARNHFNKSFVNLTANEKVQICGDENSKGAVRICCFHPSYGYEDFIEGIKPRVMNGQTVFEPEDGIFKELCIYAAKTPTKKFYLIIDEINRGDISRIFGELIMLIETGKRGKTLILPLSKKTFKVPENVYIVGTMNTADRSIALLDVALRRRFGFIELMPEYSFFEGVVFGGLPLDGWLKKLNKQICENIGKDARNLQIGHSYFLEKEKAIVDNEKFKRIIREDILPLIEEYCYGDYSLMAKVLGEGLVDTKNQLIRYEMFASSDIANLISALLTTCPELRANTVDESPDAELDEENVDVNGEV